MSPFIFKEQMKVNYIRVVKLVLHVIVFEDDCPPRATPPIMEEGFGVEPKIVSLICKDTIHFQRTWCKRRDLNPYAFQRQILSLVPMPIRVLSLKIWSTVRESNPRNCYFAGSRLTTWPTVHKNKKAPLVFRGAGPLLFSILSIVTNPAPQ